MGRPRRRERPSLFLSYPPPRPPLPPPASPFVSSIHRPTGVGRSYDLHPSCLPLSLPLTLSCPLPSPTDVRELDLLETRAASNGVFPPLLILTAPRPLVYRATRRLPDALLALRPSASLSPTFGIISAVFYRSHARRPGERAG